MGKDTEKPKESGDRLLTDLEKETEEKMERQKEADTETEPDEETEKEKEKQKEKEEPPFDGVPTDSGWSWVICICVLFNMTVIIGFNRSGSVLFVDYMELYEQPASVITLMFTCQAMSSSVSTIVVSNILMARFTVRSIAMAAALLNCITTIFISFAPNIITFLIAFCFKGFSFGALLVAPMSLIGFYFRKRRALASSITNTGFCVAFIGIPLITEMLRITYGVQGCLWILCGIEMQLLVSSMFLRSVESYRTLYAKSQRDKAKASATGKSGTDSNIVSGEGAYDLVDNKQRNNNGQPQNGKTSKNTSVVLRDKECEDFNFAEICHRQRSKSDAKFLQDFHNQLSKGPLLATSLRELRRLPSSSSDTPNGVDQFDHYRSQLSIISGADMPYLPPGIQAADVVEVESIESGDHKKKSRCCSLKRIIDTSLFKIWRFRMMAMYYPMACFSNYLFIYMPTIAITAGVDKTDAALLMTIGGAMDLVTRIISGFLGDKKFVSKPKMVAASLLVIVAVSHLSRFFKTYTSFVVFAVVVGVFGGFRQNFFQIMLIEYCGVERLAKAFGISAMLVTLTLSLNHPVIGALLDATGNFNLALHYVGTILFISIIILSCEPIFRRLDEKRESKKTAEEQHLKDGDPERGTLKA
ncbi:uncharacterized protein LOC101850960 [Aplysia californica]|uniref:Uncharacterized protein LOC101850960 n=1 Tax=Aplysia californica TaxID=6500 RepID=A0ABM1A1I4_APLCA|nr:uncharacterized protein LOC101850960 [Aplysia californica]